MNFKIPLVVAAIVACSVSPEARATSESQKAEWQFDVLLDGKPIGFHTFELQQEGGQTVLRTEASFDVKFLFITAFRYRHQNTEIWNEDCLLSIDAATNSNGKELLVRGEASDDRFSLQNTEGTKELPSCVQTFAYWNPAVLGATQLLNSQTGVYEDVEVSLEGSDQFPVGGQPVDALRYRLSAKAGDITLWYSETDNTWLGLEAPAKGGRKLLYQAVAVPRSDVSEQLFAGSN